MKSRAVLQDNYAQRTKGSAQLVLKKAKKAKQEEHGDTENRLEI